MSDDQLVQGVVAHQSRARIKSTTWGHRYLTVSESAVISTGVSPFDVGVDFAVKNIQRHRVPRAELSLLAKIKCGANFALKYSVGVWKVFRTNVQADLGRPAVVASKKLYLKKGHTVAKKTHAIQITLILAGCLAGTNAYAGKLDKVRKATTDSSSSASPPKHSRSSSNSDEDLLGVELGLAIIFSPFWIPHLLAEGDESTTGYFTGGPYQKDRCGNMDIQMGENWFQASLSERPDDTSPVSLRLGTEYSYDFDNVHKPGAQFFLDTYTRLGLESRWTYFYEKPNNDKADSLTIGDVNLTFRFAQNNHIQLYAGIGSRIMIDHGHPTFGVNFTYGIDMFPVKPLVVSLVGDIGSLGEAVVSEARATIGFTVKKMEIYGGYDTLRIGDDRFHGPILGLRKWF